MICLLIILVPAGSALARAHVAFPNPSSLQPPPENIQPNISGNVQSSLSPAAPILPEGVPAGGSNTVGDTHSDESAPLVPTPQTKHSNTGWLLGGGFILVGLTVLLIMRRRLND